MEQYCIYVHTLISGQPDAEEHMTRLACYYLLDAVWIMDVKKQLGQPCHYM